MIAPRSSKGISVLSALVAMLVLAALGGGMITLVAVNHEARANQYTSDQSHASAHAGLEVVLGLINSGANPCDSMSRRLMGAGLAGNNVVVSRTNGRIYVTASQGSSNSAVSVVDPSPPTEGTGVLIDTGDARDASNGAPPKKLIGVTLQLDAACGSAVTLTTMVVTWTPAGGGGGGGGDDDPDEDDDECDDEDDGCGGEMVNQIKLDNKNIYNSSDGTASGELIDVTDTTINDAGEHALNFIRWDLDIQNRLYTIQFNFSDGSSNIVTVDTR